MFDLQCHGLSIFFQPHPFYHPSCSLRYNLFHFVNAFYIGITDGLIMAQQRIICGAKQVSLQLLAARRGVSDVGVSVFAPDDAVCTNLTSDVYCDTRCTHTEPHVKSGLQ